MARIKKYGDNLIPQLTNYNTFVTDSDLPSPYLLISEFKDTLTGGKNGFMIEGSPYFTPDTEILIQVLDVNGDPIYNEPSDGLPEYYEGLSKVVSMHIYEDTPIGVGKITILGQLDKTITANGDIIDIPEQWRGIYNYKWERIVKINPKLPNTDYVRFYRRPTIEISEINKVLYNNPISVVNRQGSITGIPIFPLVGETVSNINVPLSYLLRTTDGSKWTSSLFDNTIRFTPGSITSSIIDIVNDTDMLISTPYTVNGKVSSFTNGTYSIDYNTYGTYSPSAITGSFAKIKISNLETFVGDVYRVKIYRKSQSDLSDWQFVQDLKLESNEILVDLDVTDSLQTNYGIFTDSILSTYWGGTVTRQFNTNYLFNSAKLSSTSGINTFFTNNIIDIEPNTEYSLSFNLRKSGSLNTNEYISAYISGSDGVQSIVKVPSQQILFEKTNIVKNIVSNYNTDTHLYFDVSGSDWYVSDISLRASQETSFSPDVITFIQSVPRTLPNETFNYKFEFYDVNNNYIPVDVITQKTFTGGNTIQNLKSLKLSAVPSSFVFDKTNTVLPPTAISITATKEYLTGSIFITSKSYDTNGVEITSAGDTSRGGLNVIDELNYSLASSNFIGDNTPVTQYIKYTATCEDVSDTLIVSRVNSGVDGTDGLDAYTVYLTNDNVTFPANSKGVVSGGDFPLGNFEIRFIKGDTEYSFHGPTPLTINTYNITSITVSPDKAISYTNSTVSGRRTFTITGIDNSIESGTITIVMQDNEIPTNTFTKVYTYSKAKRAAPILTISTTNNAQSVSAKSTGAQIDAFANATVTVSELYNGSTNNITITTLTATSSDIASISTTPASGLVTLNGKTLANATNSTTVAVSATVTDSEGTTRTLTDTITLSKVKKAAPIITISLDKQTQVVNAQSGPTSFGIPSDITVIVNEGASNYTYTTGTPAENQFKITSVTNGTNNNNGTIKPATPTTSAGTSGTITIDYVNSEGTTFTGKTINFNVGVAVDGANGSSGTNAKVVTLTASQYVVKYDGNGNKIAVAIILTATQQNHVGTVYYEFLKGTTTKQNTTSNTYTILDADEPGVGIVDIWTVKTREGGSGNAVVAFDQNDIFGIKDGTDSYTVFLTNEAHTLPADNSGTVSSYVGSGTSVIVYKGSTELNGITSGTPTLGQFTVTPSVTTGTIIVGTKTSSENPMVFADHSGMITDLAIIEYTINLENLVTLKKYQTLSKSKAGATGATGATGQRTATGMVYYQSTSITAPTTPSATSYTFSTNTFSGLTENWAFGAPTYQAGNTNKYWYSTYTAVETNPGGGTAIPAFSTPAQAINFTGLVTFTSTDNITDGVNTSNIVGSGSVTNHIGGPNLTTINGGKISTGVITSTGYSLPSGDTLASGTYTDAGTIFNLDNGSLRSKNFYINSSGNAFFRGTLAAAGGTFSGDISAATGTFTGTVSVGTSPQMKLGKDVNGTNSGLYLDANNYWYTSSAFKVGNATNYLQWDNSSLLVRGVVSASAGNFAGKVTMGTTGMAIGVGVNGSNNGLYINTNNYWYDTAAFKVGGSTNFLQWDNTNLNVRGVITATSGSIGGWLIGSSVISSSNAKIVLDSPNASIFIKDNSGNNAVTIKSGSLTTISVTTTTGQLAYNSSAVYNATPTPGVILTTTIFSINITTAGYRELTLRTIPSINTAVRLGSIQTVAPSVSYEYYISGPNISETRIFGDTIGMPAGKNDYTFNGGSVSGKYVSNFAIGTYSIIRKINWQPNGASVTNIQVWDMPIRYELNDVMNNFAELATDGLQIYKSGTNYVKISKTSISDNTMLEVGGDIKTTGDVIAFATSDIRLKENIKPIENSLELIKNISGNTYTWKPGFEDIHSNTGDDVGIIAQDVENILPSAVNVRQNGYKSVNYEKIIPLLVEAIKELTKKIDILENKL